MSAEPGSSHVDETRATGRGKRAVISAACRRCRQRKKRCDGKRPSCANCTRSNNECDYEAIAVNETRGHAARRQTAALHTQLEDVARSLALLKAMPHGDAMRWLMELRSAEDPMTVLNSIRDAASLAPFLPPGIPGSSTIDPLLFPSRTELDYALAMDLPSLYPLLPIDTVVSSAALSPTISEAVPHLESNPYGRSAFSTAEDVYPGPLQPRTLCDERLEQLDLAYWTPVPIPNDLAARLLSLYFVTDHPLHSPFDADLFIGDLTSRSSQFCSALLVNSILYWACQTYAAIEPTALRFGGDFGAVATRLLRASHHNDSILNVASLFCLTVGSICAGEDAAAKRHLRNFLHMAVALRLHGANSATPDELELFTPDSLSAYAYTAWASYNFCCIYISHYRVGDWLTFVSKPPLLPVPGAELMDSLYSTYKSPPPYMGQTFVQYCYLLQINRGIMVAYLDEESSPAKSVPLAFAEDMYRRLLEWAGQLPESLAARDDMPHHAAVLHASFHSMVMELFRPFLFQRTKLARIPRPDTRPGDLFLSSSNRMVEIFRLYYTRYRDSSPIHTITWLIAPIYTAHIALRGTADTLQQRRLDFKMCIDALMALGVVLPMKEAIVRGTMGMAVLSGLMTLQESRLMLKEALKGERQAEMVGTTLTIDFQLAMEDPNGSSVDVFAKQYLAMGSSEA